MKQFTTVEQTAKLIELGFEKPKSVLLYAQSIDCDNNYGWKGEVKQYGNYSIGELIEMLPPKLGGHHLSIERYIEYDQWLVCYEISMSGSIAPELCDALYNMIVKMEKYKMI